MTYKDYNGYRIRIYSHSYKILTVNETVVHREEGFRFASDAREAAEKYIDENLVGKYVVTLNKEGQERLKKFVAENAKGDSVDKIKLVMILSGRAEKIKKKLGLDSEVNLTLNPDLSKTGANILFHIPERYFTHVKANKKVMEIGNIVIMNA